MRFSEVEPRRCVLQASAEIGTREQCWEGACSGAIFSVGALLGLGMSALMGIVGDSWALMVLGWATYFVLVLCFCMPAGRYVMLLPVCCGLPCCLDEGGCCGEFSDVKYEELTQQQVQAEHQAQIWARMPVAQVAVSAGSLPQIPAGIWPADPDAS